MLIRIFACLFICFSLSGCALAKDKPPVRTYADINWSNPEGFALTADIHVPEAGKEKYPVLVIYHGGGWLVNTNSIMNDMATYMAAHGNYVVVNTNYRLLADQNNTVTVDEIIGDAMGALLWVKDNIQKYKGDPEKIIVTGDSAGGHLASMVLLAGRALESDGFEGKTLGFKPSYLPKGMTAEQVAAADGLKVQGAILSYTAFDLYGMAAGGFESAQNPFWGWAKVEPRGLFGKDVSVKTRPDFYKAASPKNHIPDASSYRLPPQFVLVGSKDELTTPEIAREYVQTLEKAGHPVSLKVYRGKGHGFLDSGCNDYTNGCFEQLAVPTLRDMIKFIDKTLGIK